MPGAHDRKIALITGASKGLGLELCRRLFQSGHDVVAIAREIAIVEDLKETWCKQSADGVCGALLTIAIDATDEGSVRSSVERVKERFGGLDWLINNVGGLPSTGTFQDLSVRDWQRCIDLNLMTAVRFSSAAFEYLKCSKTARVINMTSITALEPGSFNPHYSASKAALLNLTKHLSNVWAEHGILVNSIAAGPFDSPALRGVIQEKAKAEGRLENEVAEEFITALNDRVPLRRLGTIEEVANLTLFLLSEKASWITGSNICIDGGKHKGIL